MDFVCLNFQGPLTFRKAQKSE